MTYIKTGFGDCYEGFEYADGLPTGWGDAIERRRYDDEHRAAYAEVAAAHFGCEAGDLADDSAAVLASIPADDAWGLAHGWGAAMARREATMEAGPPEGDAPLCPHCGAIVDGCADGASECRAGCVTCDNDCDLLAVSGSTRCEDCAD